MLPFFPACWQWVNNWNSVAARFVTTACFVTKVTKRVKCDAMPARFVTRCTFYHPFASNTIICLSFPSLCVCVCVCARAHVYAFVCASAHAARTLARACVRACVCAWVCVDVHLSVAPRAPACVLLCIVFISAKLKFCIALCIYRLRGCCCL